MDCCHRAPEALGLKTQRTKPEPTKKLPNQFKGEFVGGLPTSAEPQSAETLQSELQILSGASMRRFFQRRRCRGFISCLLCLILARTCCYRLHPREASRLEAFSANSLDMDTSVFAKDTELVGASNCRTLKKQDFLQNEPLLNARQVDKVVVTHPQVLSCSIEDNLKPTVDWIKGLGLKQTQVAKVVARLPAVLGYSVEDNLQPKVDWIKGLGLNQAQVAKVVVRLPSVLGYSIEANLQPTVDWIKGLGLNQMQVAKVIVSHPQVLGLSIEDNLQPTVDWIKGLLLNQAQVAKMVVRFPHLLSYSIENNLQPTVDWIKGLGLNETQAAKVVARLPPVLGCSIEDNLQPTVDWIKGVGLSQSDVAEAIVKFPQLVSLSVEQNLRGKHRLLLRFFPAGEVAKLVAGMPTLLGYSYARLQRRLDVLESCGELSKLASAMTLTREAFDRRFPYAVAVEIGRALNCLGCVVCRPLTVLVLAQWP